MSFSQVHLQIVFLCIFLLAELAIEYLAVFICMNANMFLQIPVLGKAATTYLALVWFFACV